VLVTQLIILEFLYRNDEMFVVNKLFSIINTNNFKLYFNNTSLNMRQYRENQIYLLDYTPTPQ